MLPFAVVNTSIIPAMAICRFAAAVLTLWALTESVLKLMFCSHAEPEQVAICDTFYLTLLPSVVVAACSRSPTCFRTYQQSQMVLPSGC